ncbi:hypothetical protein [Pseudovibrio sp. Ad26]|uniref:hypothetical protein n=1 Tax=Pseudovibrio sp. Ad26 TaxID=989410 RepID=UPI0012901FC5|nr:hypothetical protein [Pseudovibrio sp. Ad26]
MKLLKDREKAKQLRNIGYNYFGPILVDFCRWLHSERKIIEYNNILLFVARDGHLLKRIYNTLYPEESCEYFLASRISRHFSELTSIEKVAAELRRSASDYSYRNALKLWYDLKLPLFFNLQHPKEKEGHARHHLSFYDFAIQHSDLIFEKALIHRKKYLEYTQRIIGSKHPIIVDIGYKASTQAFLSDLLEHDVSGLYMVTHKEAMRVCKDSGLIRSYDGLFVSAKDQKSVVNNYRFVFEAILTAPSGAFVAFDQLGQPLFERDVRSQITRQIISNIHSGILDFANDATCSKRKIEQIENSKCKVKCLLSSPTKTQAQLFEGLEFCDSFKTTERLYIVSPQSKRFDSFSLWAEGQLRADDINLWDPWRAFGSVCVPIAKPFLPKGQYLRLKTNCRKFIFDKL